MLLPETFDQLAADFELGIKVSEAIVNKAEQALEAATETP